MSRLASSEKPTVLENVNVSIRDFAPGVSFPFSFSGKLDPAGQIQLDGNAGPVNPADPSLTPIQLKLKLSGVDIAGLGISAGSGLGGVLNVDGAGSMNGQSLDWKGLVRIDRARLSHSGTPAKQPLDFDFALVHDLKRQSGVLRQGDIHLGAARASLTGTYSEAAAGAVLNLRLVGNAMPVNALTALLPPLGVQLPAGSSLEGGSATVNAAITGPTANVLVAGSAGLSNTVLKGFDLGSKIGAIERIAGIQPSADTAIQTLSADIRSDNAGTAVQNLQLVVPSIGGLNGSGTIDPRNNLDFRMRATIHTQGAIMAAVGQRHDTAIPFFVQGNAANPVFKPDVAGIAASEVQRLSGKKVGGVDAGKAINKLKGIFHK
ncbi:MAG: hypothetical protein KGN84_09495 [Acidobacteriota bacterium]|nr:hypothetical protein [Acidobacteriota bacterium]